ncbi:MAG: di-heme oxidoredictase family protein [Myxococcota bacterium]
MSRCHVRAALVALATLSAPALTGCPDDGASDAIAEEIFATPGQPVAYATPEELATFERGKKVALRRFTPEDGLGPSFNLTFCGGCHERPTLGGGAPRYRDFFLVGFESLAGSFLTQGNAGVRPQFDVGEADHHPGPKTSNVIAKRSGTAFFGVGALAEIPEEEILKRADPLDADGDGIRGRPNYDRGFVGRFGRKAQTVSLEGFIRGPIKNHLGITTDPLPDARKALLPIPSAADPSATGTRTSALRMDGLGTKMGAQAAAPAEPTRDNDGVPDPELGEDDLFDVVAMTMLMGAPRPDPPTEESEAGRAIFGELGCTGCHTPALRGPRGMVPAYTDLLLHDMGPELDDRTPMQLADGRDWRTQPLWGVVAVGPWLHDGRADTLDEAIRLHGGEAEASRDAYVALTDAERALIMRFLESLGGRESYSPGLIPPGTPVAELGEYGGPSRALNTEESAVYLAGRAVFDRDFAIGRGLGPNFNGDSCRACHFDPVVGGAGPLDVNVTRHGYLDRETGVFTAPSIGTMAHKGSTAVNATPPLDPDADCFELRQTPAVFGLGLIEQIPTAAILMRADPDDLDGDGIRGRARMFDATRAGRFGWKAGVPTVEEFLRDAMTNEMGMTLPARDGQSLGVETDDDGAADPELSDGDYDALKFFLQLIGPPPRDRVDIAREDAGEEVFERIGCEACHTASMATAEGVPVNLYSDLLLHNVAAEGAIGIEDGDAGIHDFRTAPLWGVGKTAPYMHDGRAATLEEAIVAHDGEGAPSRESYLGLDAADQEALLAFLRSL